MLLVTRINGTQFYVNAELIRFIEETPDTVITLSDQTKLVVAEKADVIVNRYIRYRQQSNTPWKPDDGSVSLSNEG